VDLLRGVVMIVMALDHVRDFFHSAAMNGWPSNLATTTPETFLALVDHSFFARRCFCCWLV
jgi:uncharacterized membrane protein